MKERNLIPATQAAAPMPRPKFGVRVSKDVPVFEFADLEFSTRLISTAEEVVLAEHQSSLSGTRTTDAEGVESTTDPTNLQLADGMADIVSDLLSTRLVASQKGEGDATFTREGITREWVKANMVSSDFGPLLYLLRTGQMQPENIPLTTAEEALEEDAPNAEASA
jgi:hypothetical protein